MWQTLSDLFTLAICGFVAFLLFREWRWRNVPPSQRPYGKRRRALAAEPRQAAPARASDAPAMPWGAMLGIALRHEGRRLRGFAAGLWAGLTAQQKQPAMSSNNGSVSDDLSYKPLVLAPYSPERTAYSVPAPRTEAVQEPVPAPETAEPAYKLRQARVEAMALLLARGASVADLLAIQDGDAAAIRRILLLPVPKDEKAITFGQLASAMGGTRGERLKIINAAAEAVKE